MVAREVGNGVMGKMGEWEWERESSCHGMNKSENKVTA